MGRSGVLGGGTGQVVIAPMGAILNVNPINPGYLNGSYSFPLAQRYRRWHFNASYSLWLP